ncbi:uncharacterized protein batf2 isoform X2 [Tachysurus fulvidraco]|uniref:uncharacterized protein batf2 isoform X2 n=1 Tax=Tachysurus fulvidraco TaxID=1234273 RepID=UPI001FEEE89A|nr:uncharacterized protein batf2 isoform X2 [Tachysurus fulvidraco]
MQLGRVAKNRQRGQMCSMRKGSSRVRRGFELSTSQLLLSILSVHTEKHKEMQTLEQANATLVKEISELEKEMQRYTTALKEHEQHCTLSCWSGPSIPHMSTSSSHQSFNNPKPSEEPVFPTHDPAAPDVSLAELLDRTDWVPWDFDIRLPPF